MKISSWNINSVRARTDRLLGWLESRQPDVLCLQELKCTDEQFPRMEVEAAGYQVETFGQKSYNGVAIISKLPMSDVERGMGDDPDDVESRVIAATIGGIRVVSVYVPNGRAVGLPTYDYKLEWYGRFRRYFDSRYSTENLIAVCGDYNVAPDERDVWDVPLWTGQCLFTIPEREAWSRLCEFPFVDTFRALHEEPGRYSYWDYHQLGFPKNHGLRIDHILASPPLAARLVEADIDREARKGKLPSDHTPIWAEFSA